MYINLLSPAHQREQLIQARCRQWLLVWLAVIPLLVAVSWLQWSRYKSSALQLARIAERHRPVEKLKQENETLQSRLTDLRRREQLVLELDEKLAAVDLLGHVSLAAAATQGGASVRQFSINRGKSGDVRSASGRDRTAVDAEALGTLVLEGIAVDNACVAQFVSQLRETEAFTEVHLSATMPVKVGDTPARSFQLQCSY